VDRLFARETDRLGNATLVDKARHTSFVAADEGTGQSRLASAQHHHGLARRRRDLATVAAPRLRREVSDGPDDRPVIGTKLSEYRTRLIEVADIAVMRDWHASW